MLIDFEDRTEESQEMMLAYLDGRAWKPMRRRRFSGNRVLAVMAGIQLAIAILSVIAPRF